MTTPTGRARVPGSYATGRTALNEGRPVDFDLPGGPGGGGPRPPAPGGTPYRRRGPRPRWGRIALVIAAALVLLTGVGGFVAYVYANHLDELRSGNASGSAVPNE